MTLEKETINKQAFEELLSNLEKLEKKNELLKENLNEMGKGYSTYEEVIYPTYITKMFQIYSEFFEVDSGKVIFSLNSKAKNFDCHYQK